MHIREAAQRCGFELEQFKQLLALPDTDKRKPRSLVQVDGEHLTAASVFAFVKHSEQRQGVAQILSDDDLAYVLGECAKMRFGVRNRALIALSNYTGVRAVEISRLRLCDIVDSKTKQLRHRVTLPKARTKNKVPRRLYFNKQVLRKAMQAHINDRFSQGAHITDHVFVGVISKEPLTRQNLARMMKYIYEQCDHPECSSHSGRARVATKTIKTQDVKAAQLLLGHSSGSTTLKYVRYTDDELEQIAGEL